MTDFKDPELLETSEPDVTPGVADEIESLRKALTEKTEEAKGFQDKYLRALAELENYRKRVQREREAESRYVHESLMRDLLPVLDNFERALAAAKSSQDLPSVVAGVELIHRDLLRYLERAGVTPFEAMDQAFDPQRHEAVSRVESGEAPENTVVGEVLRGYMINGRVLRPAKVQVASRPADPPPGPDR